mmetsp:Transcript_24447/g.36485  ORF Transcript_24447/g.36485 Transcript_24447/m.36485 type:complete len:97 (-) Transcript_24447:34-324(-)
MSVSVFVGSLGRKSKQWTDVASFSAGGDISITSQWRGRKDGPPISGENRTKTLLLPCVVVDNAFDLFIFEHQTNKNSNNVSIVFIFAMFFVRLLKM